MENAPAFAPEGRPASLNGADMALAGQVARWRAMGMSWDGVGRALRRSTPDVRAAFDANFMRSAPAPSGPVSRGRLACLSPMAQQALATLSGKPRSSSMLAAALGVAQPQMTAALKALRDAGLAEISGPGQWDLTVAGRLQAVALAKDAAASLPDVAAKVLAALARTANGPRTAAQVAGVEEAQAREAIVELRRLGLAERRSNGTFVATWTGRAAAERRDGGR